MFNKPASAPFDIANVIYSFTKQATLLRRSTVLSHPLQLAFPATGFLVSAEILAPIFSSGSFFYDPFYWSDMSHNFKTYKLNIKSCRSQFRGTATLGQMTFGPMTLGPMIIGPMTLCLIVSASRHSA